MSIRLLFTISIALVALLTTVLFSSLVYLEFREEQYEIIDRELFDVGEAIFKKCEKDTSGHFHYNADEAEYPLNRYWIKLSGPKDTVIYQSMIAQMADIAYLPHAAPYFVERKISLDSLWIDPADEEDRSKLRDDTVRFRVVTMGRDVSGTELSLVIAKPIPVIAAELREIIYEVAFWSILAVFLVFAISYYLAGRVLRPLKTINQLTREIRESSLDKRIPERKNQDELHTLTQSLNSMFDRLQHSFQLQKEFVSNASHELKSPLTVLRLSLEDLLSTPLPDNIRKEIATQLKTTQRLQKLIYDLLDISRLEQQETIHRDQFDVTELIREVLDDYAEILKARNFTVSAPSDSCMILADREKVRRMLINLIDNAIKYNYPCNGFIRISLEHKDKNLEISIASSGDPIPKEDIPLIFDQFFRVEKSRSQQYGGTGLGLTIVKKIAELHGGSVFARSSPDHTIMSVILPIVED